MGGMGRKGEHFFLFREYGMICTAGAGQTGPDPCNAEERLRRGSLSDDIRPEPDVRIARPDARLKRGNEFMTYTSAGLLAIIVHLIINFHVIRNTFYKRNTDVGDSYRRLVLSMMAFFVFDAFWGVLYEARLITLVFIDTVLYFIAMAATVFLLTRYAVCYLRVQGIRIRVLHLMGWAFIGFMAVSLILNCFKPVMFWFDEAGNYHAGNFRYIALAMQVLLFLSVAVLVLVTGFKGDRSSKRHHLAIGMFAVTMAVMVILQVAYPLQPMYTIGCLLGGCIIHTFVIEDLKEDRRLELEEMIRREKQKDLELGSARHLAYTDSLTGVKNTHSYVEMEKEMDQRIAQGDLKELGVIVFDLNDLKRTNDTRGHEAGDQLIQTACRMICRRFKHSPVYRIGGDEFVAVLEGEDYQYRKALLDEFEHIVEMNQHAGKVVVASGLATFRPGKDNSYRKVFERADRRMYERKGKLKAMTSGS